MHKIKDGSDDKTSDEVKRARTQARSVCMPIRMAIWIEETETDQPQPHHHISLVLDCKYWKPFEQERVISAGRCSGFPHWMTSTVQPPSGLESYFLSCRHRMLFGPSSCSVQGSIFSPTKGTNRDTTGGRTWRWLCIPALQFLADSLCPHLSFCVHPWRDKQHRTTWRCCFKASQFGYFCPRLSCRGLS